MTNPSPEDIQLATQLHLCPWCTEPTVHAPQGPKVRCRHCNRRWETTPYGGLIEAGPVGKADSDSIAQVGGEQARPSVPGQSPGGLAEVGPVGKADRDPIAQTDQHHPTT